jgi:hypothetical protein
MTADATKVRDEFIRRHIDRLATPSPTPRVCSQLADARSAPKTFLRPDEYEAGCFWRTG